jgi:tetratricopeptide (TPR) repeat protein
VLRDHSLPPRSDTSKAAPERDGGTFYTRLHVCRLLQISARQLKIWERQQLIPVLEQYRFSDILLLKTISRLREEKVTPQLLRRSLGALRHRLGDIPHQLDEARLFKEGKTLRVHFGKVRMEPLSGQLLFDFHDAGINKLFQLARTEKQAERNTDAKRKLEADQWFERGLSLEQRGAPLQEIIDAYQKSIELDPRASGALVNLGTIFFNGHAWADAEEQYLRALEIDPNYPLAHFNLGNLYDERGDLTSALEHYQIALKQFPNYADVHYNIALLYQSQGDVMSAVRHWKAYLKLDNTSSWSQIARRELGKLEAMTLVSGSRRVRVARTGEE